MSQFVYVLEDKNTHLLKIGISIDPEFRAKQVSKDFGCDAVVAGILEVQDARKTEQFIHGMLSDCRVLGEWFEVAEKKKNYLLTYFDSKFSPNARISRKSSASSIPYPPIIPNQVKVTQKEDVPLVSHIKLKLRELLDELRVKPKTIEDVARRDLGYSLGENTIYRILKTDTPTQVNLESLAAIIHAIRHHTGRDVQVGDVLEWKDDSV